MDSSSVANCKWGYGGVVIPPDSLCEAITLTAYSTQLLYGTVQNDKTVTVEPLYNGHFEPDNLFFIHYPEVD